jgi:hypothetical protein
MDGFMLHAVKAPVKVQNRANDLRQIGKMGVLDIGAVNQLIVAPEIMAPVARSRAGCLMFMSLFEIKWVGEDEELFQITDNVSRIE